MKRLTLGGLLLAYAALSTSCQTADPGAGSNTNWLRSCDTDAACGEKLSCLCGVCTAPCAGSCPDQPGAVCAGADSAPVRAQCGSDLPGAVATSGMCLPVCDLDTPCAARQLCLDGSCLQLAGVDATSACVAGAQVELSAGGVVLQARYGTLFGDALYLPVAYDARPARWTEPMTPTPIVATVTTPEGSPVVGCTVRFITAGGSGAAFADAPATDKNGQTTAYWVAGDRRRQSLLAALVDRRGALHSASVDGTAYANDEGAQSTDAAATVAARPATVRLGFDLPATSNRLRVVLSAATYPHHAFYSALNIDGFFAGLQNTSGLDALADGVADAERILIASIWNLPEADAQQLYAMDGLACGPHYQELGGIRCTLGGAWQPQTDYVFELERTTLAQGESGPDYTALGYLTDACASAAGCTDYTLYFGTPDAVNALTRVVAYRYQSADVATSFGTFIQSYLELPAQNSCLFTPEYAARFQPFVQNGARFEPVLSADFSAAYLSWHNEVCANYAATPDANGFSLVTGGPRPLGRPVLPDEPARRLTLP